MRGGYDIGLIADPGSGRARVARPPRLKPIIPDRPAIEQRAQQVEDDCFGFFIRCSRIPWPRTGDPPPASDALTAISNRLRSGNQTELRQEPPLVEIDLTLSKRLSGIRSSGWMLRPRSTRLG